MKFINNLGEKLREHFASNHIIQADYHNNWVIFSQKKYTRSSPPNHHHHHLYLHNGNSGAWRYIGIIPSRQICIKSPVTISPTIKYIHPINETEMTEFLSRAIVVSVPPVMKILSTHSMTFPFQQMIFIDMTLIKAIHIDIKNESAIDTISPRPIKPDSREAHHYHYCLLRKLPPVSFISCHQDVEETHHHVNLHDCRPVSTQQGSMPRLPIPDAWIA